MTTSRYRCAGCRQYHLRPEYRRVGLGAVCSEQCLRIVTQRKTPPSPKPDVPDDVRRAVRERDRGRCRLCGTTVDLQAHHIAYRSEGGTHHEHNLITLCATHHALVHTDKGRWQPVLFTYVRAFYGQGRRMSLLLLDRQLNAQAAPVELD